MITESEARFLMFNTVVDTLLESNSNRLFHDQMWGQRIINNVVPDVFRRFWPPRATCAGVEDLR